MHERWKQIKQLQLNGDAEIWVTAAKSYIESTFLQILKASGVATISSAITPADIELYFDLLPQKFQIQRQPTLELLRELKHMDRKLDWYDGDRIDHARIAKEFGDRFDLVLDLLKPEMKG